MDPSAILPYIELINTYVIKPIKPHIDHALRKRRYREALKKKVDDLGGKQQRLNGLVADASRETREIDQQVQLWQTNVEKRIAADRPILEEYESLAQQRCFFRLCPNFIKQYQLNYKAEVAVTAVDELLVEAEGYDAVEKISHLPPSIAERPPIVVGDYESFRSREFIVQRVVDELTVLGKSKFGVYGMGGVGKTTLVEEVARKVTKKPFDFVVYCKVTAVPNIENIQKEIMDELGLKIREESPNVRATRLLEKLEKMLNEKKKILFVLDDLWKKLKLETVGIPSPDQHKGCQILMTSRQRPVLSTEMGCDNNVILIDLLSEDEAWVLFKKMSGNNFEKNNVLLSKAREVAKACARLPIAIVTVARALKNKTNLPDWESVLLNFQRPSVRSFSAVQVDDPEIREHVHKSIYLSYKLLPSDELRSTLLMCSQFPNNSSIRELLRHSWSLHLLPQNSMSKVEDAQNMLRFLVGQLQDSCMLLDTGSNERIALHDIVRGITKAIASEENHVFTTSPEDNELTYFPDDQNCARMWLRCKVAKLPEKLGYPQLELFHMDNVSTGLEVPDGIFRFEGGQRLKVLSLTNFCFPRSLPSSLESLKENLRMLCLDGSSLKDTAITIIGELENLEILSFAKCKIRRLPEEIGNLKKLKILDLSDCSKLEEVSRDVISRLSLLEELYMGNSFSGWAKEGGAQASLTEVAMLRHLSNLEIAIPDAGAMVENLFSKGLKRYRVTIGTDKWWDKSYATLSKLLWISLDTCIDFGFYGIQMLLSSAEVLCLGRMKEGAKNMLSEGFPQLKHLELQEKFETQYVVDAAKSDPSKAFPALESLRLERLDSLEEISHGKFRSKPFPSLAAIEVRECHKLKNLFSFSIAQGLSRLKSIEVRWCGSLEGIVGEEDEATDGKIEFSKLDALCLVGLPKLKRFCTGYLIKCPHLKTIYLSDCNALKTFVFNPSSCESKAVNAEQEQEQDEEDSEEKHQSNARPLFDEKVCFPSLAELRIADMENLEKIWHDQLPDGSFCTLRRMAIYGCKRLLNVFPSKISNRFRKLEQLTIWECSALEEIFDLQCSNVDGRRDVVDFQLREIDLQDLDNLRHIWKQDCPREMLSTFRNLQSVEATACPFLKNIFPASIARDLVQLESLEIAFCDGVEEIVAVEESIGENLCFTFPNLSSLSLHKLPKLKNFYPGMHTSEWPELKSLVVRGCHAVKLLFREFPFLTQVDGGGQIEQPVMCRSGDIQHEKGDATKGREGWNCDSLFSLTSPSARFQCLITLEVDSCDGLTYIMPPWTPKSLVKLKELTVRDCARVGEIVSKQDGKTKDDDEITFSKLESLTLVDLKGLTNFCSGGYTFKFPNLENVIVTRCPGMRYFRSGDPRTPKLKRVHLLDFEIIVE